MKPSTIFVSFTAPKVTLSVITTIIVSSSGEYIVSKAYNGEKEIKLLSKQQCVTDLEAVRLDVNKEGVFAAFANHEVPVEKFKLIKEDATGENAAGRAY
jgi:hypothetical protein